MRSPVELVLVAFIACGLVLGSCSDGDDGDGDGGNGAASTDIPDEAAPNEDDTAPVVTACERLDGDAVSFAAGEAFSADLDSATERTCRYQREAASGDSITLTVSATTLDPAVQLDALASSPASADTFESVDLGEGAFSAVIDDKPRAGVFVDGELLEVVLVVGEPLGTTTPIDDVLLTILREATGDA